MRVYVTVKEDKRLEKMSKFKFKFKFKLGIPSANFYIVSLTFSIFSSLTFYFPVITRNFPATVCNVKSKERKGQ